MKLEKVSSLGLEEGDTVVTAKGTFVVLEALEKEAGQVDYDVLFLETGRRAWLEHMDSVHGPVEVLKAP